MLKCDGGGGNGECGRETVEKDIGLNEGEYEVGEDERGVDCEFVIVVVVVVVVVMKRAAVATAGIGVGLVLRLRFEAGWATG